MIVDTGYLKYAITHKEELENILVQRLEHHKCAKPLLTEKEEKELTELFKKIIKKVVK